MSSIHMAGSQQREALGTWRKSFPWESSTWLRTRGAGGSRWPGVEHIPHAPRDLLPAQVGVWHRRRSGSDRTHQAPRGHSWIVPWRTPAHFLLELVDVSSYLHNIWPNFVFTEYLITADWIQKWLKILPALIINVLIVFSSWGWFFCLACSI